VRILWLAPGEWAVIGRSRDDIAARVADACGDGIWDVTDISSVRHGFVLRGGAAPELLAKGCSLDLDPRALGIPTCLQTLLAQLPVWIDVRSGAGPAIEFAVSVESSYAWWLREWLLDAAIEFADPPSPRDR
jgi:sarcosine oxidase subunit gamma